ncbi:MAG: hypothetical protein ACTS2F_02875 [Thainema sp.]
MSDAPFSPNHADPSRDPHTEQDGLDPTLGSAAPADDAQEQGWADWQTVQFPDALNVEALEQEEEVAKSTARANPKSAKAKSAKNPPTDQPQVKAEPPAIAPEDDDTEADVIEPDWRPHVKSRQTIEVSAQAIDEQAIEAPAPESVVDDQIEELLTLIRELNECNDALLSRVRHLEDALTQCQSELDREVMRSQHSIQQQQEQELALVAAQQRAAQSADELEFVQQTVQRQQIQIETLEAQLETSQQRVAELERECALVQQKQQEQYHQLQESKQACQDLRSRLQRQQRYTLQYKVALKKCLDVPPPRYQSAGETFTTADAPTGFMPKVSEIQPWSSTQPSDTQPSDADYAQQPPAENTSDLLAWMQSNPALTHLFRDEDETLNSPANWENDPIAQTIDLTAIQADDLFDQPITPDPVVEADMTNTVETDAIHSEAESVADMFRPQPTSISYDVKHLTRRQSSSSSADEDRPAATQAPESPSDGVAADAQLNNVQPNNVQPNAVPRPPVEAEDALWEDLARLIDASTEEEIAIADEIVFEDGEFTDASLNSDEEESALFEPNVELSSSPPTQAEAVAQYLDSQAPQDFHTAPSADHEQPDLSESAPAASQEQEPTNFLEEQHHNPSQMADSTWTKSFAPQANWPSPVVYPLRAQKPRRKSLASVELPSFPKAAH